MRRLLASDSAACMFREFHGGSERADPCCRAPRVRAHFLFRSLLFGGTVKKGRDRRCSNSLCFCFYLRPSYTLPPLCVSLNPSKLIFKFVYTVFYVQTVAWSWSKESREHAPGSVHTPVPQPLNRQINYFLRIKI
jgi:hypothetical protein